MAHAEICPVCNGVGTVTTAKPYSITAVTTPEKTCHGCGGKGWVTVTGKAQVEVGPRNESFLLNPIFQTDEDKEG